MAVVGAVSVLGMATSTWLLQGVVLLVDANQGVQAQTVSNFFLAFANNLEILAVINKIDLPNADPEGVKEQLMTLFDADPEQVKKMLEAPYD